MEGRGRGRVRAKSSARIPVELAHFANRESYTLLIKGAAGTGKTALALCILSSLEGVEDCLYICTRTSPSTVVQDHPWLGEVFDVSPKPKRVSDEGEQEDMGVFVDGRLDESTTIFERITDELMNTPRPTIVIDSWDSIGDFMEREAYFNNTKVLQSWRDRARARLILITEDPDDRTFDFLVDGVVVLRRGTWDGRIFRELHLSKLLGTEIERPSYYYTLKGSVFRCFGGQKTADLEILPDAKLDVSLPRRLQQASAIRRLETGYPEIDASLGGGLLPGSVVSIETDPTVDTKVVALFVGRVAVNSVMTGSPVDLRLFGGIDPRYMKKLMESSIPPASMGLVTMLPDAELEAEKRHVSVKGETQESSIRSFEESVKSGGFGPGVKPLVVLSGDLRAFGSADSEVPSLMRTLASKAGALILVTQRQGIAGEGVPSPVDVRLRILEKKGTLFLRSDIPWTKLYGISLHRNSGVPSLELEPVV
jgi:KaiC/GvpD/RAD55 family RecA-like ATPase